MSQLIFPSLPGLAWPVTRTVVAPPVKVKTTPSRREFRARDSTVPLYRYSVPFEFLRKAQAYQEWQQLMGFFNRVGGPFDDWLFDDLDDNTCTSQLFSIGDGATQSFQLARTFGGFLEPVYGPDPAGLRIFVNGTETAATVSSTGAVTLAAAPAANAELRWSGHFYWRCVFASESLEFSKSFASFYEARKVDFRTVKPL